MNELYRVMRIGARVVCLVYFEWVLNGCKMVLENLFIKILIDTNLLKFLILFCILLNFEYLKSLNFC